MFKRNLIAAFALSLVLGCSSNNSSSDSGASSQTGSTLHGSIKSVTGSQTEMNQWVLALVNRDTCIAHSALINAVGNYVVEGVDSKAAYTLVLLDPQYKFSSILTYAGLSEAHVRQYFKMKGARIPTLVHNGPIINFTDFSGVTWEKNEAKDSNSNLIPDSLDNSAALVGGIDTDADGLDNADDGDIDSDGLPNCFDSDDDGDSITDAFDTDANGDELADLAQNIGDQYFASILKFLTVQLVQDVQGDGSLSSTLVLTSQLQDTAQARAIRVKGSATLFEGATALHYDATTGASSSSSWDKTLSDDGKSEDGDANDGTFAARVQLVAGQVPKAKQVFLLEVEQGTEENKIMHEFPFTFPSVVTGVISGTYQAVSRKVSLVGSPFGAISSFFWSVHVYNSSGAKVFASEPIVGTNTVYILPSGATETGQTYTAKIVASAIDRIPSYPAWVIRSLPFSL